MLQQPARRALWAAVSIVVLAAFTGALLSHIAIDVAGDFVLAHDTYDAVDHRSRADVAGVALVLACCGLLRVLAQALDEAQRGRSAARVPFAAHVAGGGCRFTALVVLLCVPTLMTMELFDLVSSGTPFDGVADLLGGSLWLGLGITLPCAALVALAVGALVRWLFTSHASLVAYLERAIALLVRGRAQRAVCYAAREQDAARIRRFVPARRTRKRGPPAQRA